MHVPCALEAPGRSKLTGLHVQNEVKLLLELLPKYLAHVEKHPHTLLVKFFGLYRVVPESGSKVRQRLCSCPWLACCEALPLRDVP